MNANLSHRGPMRLTIQARALESVRPARSVPRRGALSPRTIARRAALDWPMADAMRDLTRALPKPPEPAARYYDCRYPKRIKYRPWDLFAALIDDVIDTAHALRIEIPEADILAPLDALRRYFIARLARPVPPLPACVTYEMCTQGAADPDELPLMGEPTRVDLERADAALAEHERAIGQLRAAIAQKLSQTWRVVA